jgi:hypothetical protein
MLSKAFVIYYTSVKPAGGRPNSKKNLGLPGNYNSYYYFLAQRAVSTRAQFSLFFIFVYSKCYVIMTGVHSA